MWYGRSLRDKKGLCIKTAAVWGTIRYVVQGGMIMPKTLYLHVGTHKTGTTAIQALLTTQSEAWAQGGLFVPRSGRIHDLSGHHNVAWELNADARYRPAFGTLADLCEELKASPHAVAVISSEDFECLSVISLLTHIANLFEAQKHSTIVVISSVAGDRGRQSNYVYGTAKAAVPTFM